MTDAVDTTTDAFLGGALKLVQPRHGYRAGIDAVLLAAAAPSTPSSLTIDCGSGIGTAGLCLARRVDGARVILVERSQAFAGLARQNIIDNDLTPRVHVVEADLTAPLSHAPELAAMAGSADHAIANPPYHETSRGTRSTHELRDAANAMPLAELDTWARFMAAMLRPGGTTTLIHRADTLSAVLNALAPRFGALMIVPLYPRPDEAATRVIVHGTKGSRAPLTLRAGLILHTDHGSAYTPAIEAVLRRGAALHLA
jgi:tRNA1(Val) A37 N6-methylase TrmN6